MKRGRNYTIFEINRDVDFEMEIETGLLVVKRVYKVVLVSHIMKVQIGREQ